MLFLPGAPPGRFGSLKQGFMVPLYAGVRRLCVIWVVRTPHGRDLSLCRISGLPERGDGESGVQEARDSSAGRMPSSRLFDSLQSVRTIMSPCSVCFSPDHVYLPLPPPIWKITYPTVYNTGMLCALVGCTKMEREFTLPPLGISMSIFKGA